LNATRVSWHSLDVSTPFREGLAPPEDAIRSIRVASTLIDRFRAIVSTDASSIVDLELRIGESQQIYPEIWRHLEDARRVLAANGRDVARIDELRNRELVSLGVTDVEITRELDMTSLIVGRIRYSTSKTAAFNTGGAARAHAVARALMDALPDVDWEALARAEDREIAAAGSMQTHKWLGILKLAAAAGAVLGIVLLVQRLTSGVHEAPPPPAEAPQFDLIGASRHTFVRLRSERIDELRAQYTMTCDPTHRPELVQLLRDDGRSPTAHSIEMTPCERTLPTCDKLHVPVLDRFIVSHLLVRDRSLDLICRGIVLGHPGELHTAFAVVVSGHGPDHKAYTYRGVVPIDGEKDIVPFELAPVPFFVGTGDLDGDARDELVMVGGTKLVVSHIEDHRFVDHDGPTLPASCHANANIERDFREDGKPTHESLVIEVDDPPHKGCPDPGRHYYSLVEGALVED